MTRPSEQPGDLLNRARGRAEKIAGRNPSYYGVAERRQAEPLALADDVLALVVLCERLQQAHEEIVKREARSEYSSIFAAPGEFAAISRDALSSRQDGCNCEAYPRLFGSTRVHDKNCPRQDGDTE